MTRRLLCGDKDDADVPVSTVPTAVFQLNRPEWLQPAVEDFDFNGDGSDWMSQD